LTAKRERMDHLLDGSWCYWNHDGEPSQPSSAASDLSGMGLPPGMRAATRTLKPIPPSLASHTVEMDEDDASSTTDTAAVPAGVSNGSSSSSSRPSAEAQQ